MNYAIKRDKKARNSTWQARHATVWIDYLYAQAINKRLDLELNAIEGLLNTGLLESSSPRGTTIINLCRKSDAIWEKILPQVVATLQVRLEAESMEEINKPRAQKTT